MNKNQFNKGKVKEINLKEIWIIIRKRFWVVLIFTILMTCAGYTYTTFFKSSPLYQSSTRIIIGTDENNMGTLQVMITDTSVMESVIQKLNLQMSDDQLASQITVASIAGSQVVSISVTNSDPKLAAEIVNTTAKAYKTEISKILNFKNVTLLAPAKINYIPINDSNQNMKIIIASFVGIVMGVGMTFLLNSLDDSIQSEHDVEDILGLSVLGRVSKMNKNHLKKGKQKPIELELGGESIG